MGSGVELHCPTCGWRRDFVLGVGMLYGELDNVVGLLPKAQRAQVDEIRLSHKTEPPEFQQELFVCDRCHALSGKLWVRLRWSGGKVYETEYRCRKCRGAMRVVEDATGLHCPKCGAKPLAEGAQALWD